MTAIETIKKIMEMSETTLSDLEEYAGVGTKSNICQMLSRNDLKVGTFVKMLESMGFQLVAQSTENSEEIIIDYEEESNHAI